MSDGPKVSVETLLLNNDSVPTAVVGGEPEVEPVPDTTQEDVEPVVEPEPEVTDPEVADVRAGEEPEVEPVTEDEEGGEYTPEEWDALPKEEREKIDAEWKASQESEEARVARITESDVELKKERLDFEKQKLDWQKSSAESKREADKDYQRKMELLADEAKQAGIDKEFKLRKKTERDKPASDGGSPIFPEYQPKQMVTQAEVKQNRMNQGAIDQLNQQRNDAEKVKYDKVADHFNSQSDFINEIRAERSERKAFEKRAGEWGESVRGSATELGFEAITKDGKWTPEANHIYDELGKIGVLDQNDTNPEYRANMVRLIRNSAMASPNGSTNGKAITVPKLTKAPPGQTLKASSKGIPRRKRPPQTMGGRGTGSKEVQTKRLKREDILLGNR